MSHSIKSEDIGVRPVILYGALRSGTTMLRLMLDGHPALSCPGESDFLFDHLHLRHGTWAYDRSRMEMDRIYRASPMEIPEDEDGLSALQRMIAQACLKPGSRPVLVLHRQPEKLLSLLPDAKVIHLLRDPRDVARSAIGMGWAGNVFHGLTAWMETEDSWTDAIDGRQVAVFDVRYEDLVARPAETLTDLCAFLDLHFDPEMLEYDTRSTYGKPDTKLVFQWRHKLASREIRQIEARLGPRLRASGYEPSGLPPLRISFAERLWLRARNAVSTKGRLVRRYGLRNVVQRKVARMFGLSGLEAKAQSRMDHITLRYLK